MQLWNFPLCSNTAWSCHFMQATTNTSFINFFLVTNFDCLTFSSIITKITFSEVCFSGKNNTVLEHKCIRFIFFYSCFKIASNSLVIWSTITIIRHAKSPFITYRNKVWIAESPSEWIVAVIFRFLFLVKSFLDMHQCVILEWSHTPTHFSTIFGRTARQNFLTFHSKRFQIMTRMSQL